MYDRLYALYRGLHDAFGVTGTQDDLIPETTSLMGHDALKQAVWQANLDIVEAGLVVLTWGNASAVDREAGVMAIKPSGVAYDALRPEEIVLVALDDGDPVEAGLHPSSDTPTHRYLYRTFEKIGSIVHTHSRHAVSWAQAERDLLCFGSTHADHFYGPIPASRSAAPGVDPSLPSGLQGGRAVRAVAA